MGTGYAGGTRAYRALQIAGEPRRVRLCLPARRRGGHVPREDRGSRRPSARTDPRRLHRVAVDQTRDHTHQARSRLDSRPARLTSRSVRAPGRARPPRPRHGTQRTRPFTSTLAGTRTRTLTRTRTRTITRRRRCPAHPRIFSSSQADRSRNASCLARRTQSDATRRRSESTLATFLSHRVRQNCPHNRFTRGSCRFSRRIPRHNHFSGRLCREKRQFAPQNHHPGVERERNEPGLKTTGRRETSDRPRIFVRLDRIVGGVRARAVQDDLRGPDARPSKQPRLSDAAVTPEATPGPLRGRERSEPGVRTTGRLETSDRPRIFS